MFILAGMLVLFIFLSLSSSDCDSICFVDLSLTGELKFLINYYEPLAALRFVGPF